MGTIDFIKKNNFASEINNKISLIAIATFVVFITNFSNLHAQQCCETDPFLQYNSLLGTGADYLVPTRLSNKIKTISAHTVVWKRYFKDISILMKAGITTTYAWGYSRQWYPISDFVWYAIDYKTSAYGAGPFLQIEHTIIKTKNISLLGEGSAGCILYDKRFPYGGDIYNFMLRTGPSIAYKINSNSFIKVGYRWMHVSNGQGSGNHNPFYEAQGINVGFFLIK